MLSRFIRILDRWVNVDLVTSVRLVRPVRGGPLVDELQGKWLVLYAMVGQQHGQEIHLPFDHEADARKEIDEFITRTEEVEQARLTQ